MRSEFNAVGAGFDKFPTLSVGQASRAVVVNSGGTALTTTTGTLALAGNFATVGAFAVSLIAGAAVALTLPLVAGTLATLAGTETLSNKTLVAPALGTPVSGDLSNCTGVSAGNLTGPIVSTGLTTSVAAQTGTGSVFVMNTNPVLVGPALGVATATSINKVVLTQPASAATLTIANNKTLTASNTLTFTGTDGSSVDFGTGGTVLYSGGPGTTITLTGDATGSGTTSIATTLATVNANVGTFGSSTQSVQFAVNGKGLITGAANVVITPALGSVTGFGTGVATALAINVGSAGAFVTLGGAAGTPSSLDLSNATALPIGSVTGLGTGVATWLATPSSANLAAAVTGETGSGALVFASSPTLVTPALGVATATTLNGLTISNTTGTLLLANAKTLTVNNTLALSGTDGSTVTFGAGGTVLYDGEALGTPSSGTLTNCTGYPAAAVAVGLLSDGMTAATQGLLDGTLLLANTLYVDRMMGTTRVLARGFFQAGGGVTNVKSGGVTSIARNSAGRFTVVMSAAAPDVSYMVYVTSLCNPGPGTNAPIAFEISATSRTTTTFEIGTTSGGSSYADPDYMSFIVFA